jgi:hypothetical protein
VYSLEYTCFPNAFSVLVHISLTLKTIFCKQKSVLVGLNHYCKQKSILVDLNHYCKVDHITGVTLHGTKNLFFLMCKYTCFK